MDKILKIFDKLKINIRYINTQAKLKVPYAVYQRLKNENFYAGNKRYYEFFVIRVEIYFENLEKMIELESKLEKELEKNNYAFSKSEDITLDENVVMVYYEITGGKK